MNLVFRANNSKQNSKIETFVPKNVLKCDKETVLPWWPRGVESISIFILDQFHKQPTCASQFQQGAIQFGYF